MKNKDTVFTEPENGDYTLAELRAAYVMHLKGRSKPVAPGTLSHYIVALESFEESMALHGVEPILRNLTRTTVEQWVTDLRGGVLGKKRKATDQTVASMLSDLKIFTRKFVYLHHELTTRDLLDKVERYIPPVRVEERYSVHELEKIVTVNEDSRKYTDVRDRAMMTFSAASGLRFSEIVNLEIDSYDRLSGRAKTIGKGDKERTVYVGDRAQSAVKKYLRIRRAKEGVTKLFTTDEGQPITYWGGQSIFRRMRGKVGVDNLHAHRFRHTWTQHALANGAERAVVQDQMGWTSDQMVRRYGGYVRSELAAKAMPQYAPI